jgi:hypothetical protein
MRKTLIVVASMLLAFSIGTIAFAHHGPTTVVIDAAAAKQPAVPFAHGKHATQLVKNCDKCHHTDKGLTAANDKNVAKCSSCHLDPKGDVPSMREMSLTKNPFHSLCIGCHKEGKKGPTVCKDCHVKK